MISPRAVFSPGDSLFGEPGLQKDGSFKAAEARYTDIRQVNVKDRERWLEKFRAIQWDHKNIVKRKGVLERPV